MTDSTRKIFARTYRNPVYPHSFPDPFVLKFRGEYFAYCTGDWSDGRVFGVLRSRNLVDWTDAGGAMRRLDSDAPFYWAPEVTYANGKFYLYYSVGNEALMELRVAVSDRPDGGFVDAGVKLTNEDFAIDAHVFTDDSGEKYLFYATDFLEHTHIGTGTVVDRMIDFLTLEGRPRPVTRAKYDWQVYDPARKEKGGVRWHTIEGSFVLKRKGVYYQMFSGGNWQNITYGVSFAVTDDISRDEEWRQFSDGEKVLPILRTIPELAVGPGHNSVVRGVNNRELYCVYHRWTEGGRTLSIDRQDFAGVRMFIEGASCEEKEAPLAPAFADFFDDGLSDENWQSSGKWNVAEGEVFNELADRSELICDQLAESFLCEFSARCVQLQAEAAGFGFRLFADAEKTFEFMLYPKLPKAAARWFEGGEVREQILDLPESLDFQAIHLLRVEVDQTFVKVRLDEAALNFEQLTEKNSNRLALVAENTQAAFSGFALTEGYEDLFDWREAEIEQRGWQKSGDEAGWRVAGGELIFSNPHEAEAAFAKGKAAADFEYAVNLRLSEAFGDNAAFGFLLLTETGAVIARLTLTADADGFYFVDETGSPRFALPQNFAPADYHQFRFLKRNGNVRLELEGIKLGEFFVGDEKLKTAQFCRRATVALEMARLTVLKSDVFE